MEKFKWLNKHSRLFLERGYLEPGVSPEERIRQIADRAELYLNIDGFAEKFEGYMAKGFYSLSTPIWINYGNDRGLPVSCFGSFLEDTVESILSKASEIGQMSKIGGGTSAYFGELRPRGSKISVGGESSGPVHFMELYDKVADVINQGGARRGSFAAYLPIDHPDIEEFLMIRGEGHPIQNMSIGVTISDEWMENLKNGNKKNRDIWAKLIRKRFETGYPYIFFSDTVNKNAPQVYKDKNLSVKASNLCVAPETLLLTKDGEFPICELEGKEVEVWNGKQWSKTTVVRTGTNQKVIRIDLQRQDGERVDLWTTEYHKFYLVGGSEARAYEIQNSGRGLALETWVDPNGNSQGGMVSLPCSDFRYCDTYCVNEQLEHKAVFNGYLTGNCSEITLSSDSNNSFVCVLSSLNLLHWDEIKETDAIETLIYFLDTVNEEFVNKTENMPFMKTSHHFAKTQRALGAGVLGWHSLLQSKMIPFESLEAKILNNEIWKTIRERADKATQDLAGLYGEPELLKGYGRRNVTTLAVAPTTSSSFILGQVSPSIEPENSCYYVKKLAKGSFTYKNPFLKKLLASKDADNDETWESILTHGGSVQHLDILSDEEKLVFKTFGEISQKEIVIQAAQRQKRIDQAQSLNLSIDSHHPAKEVSQLLIEAWEMGVKTLYYQRGTSPAQKLSRSILNCSSCEG